MEIGKKSLIFVLNFQKSMKWGPWAYYWMLYSGSSALSFCDYIGESLANTLGITSPKYQYELDEYNAAIEQVRPGEGGRLRNV